mmetsp:Transcript_44/g.67  ORF Transcript_44/g.67 Transcript_44/m.67 type:complete len:134 (+) Transcript_44:368-769(+)
MVKPKEETDLSERIKWDKCGNEEQALFENAHKGKHNPVSQPLLIIGVCGRVECLERHVSWVDKGYQIGKELGTTRQIQDSSGEGASSKKKEDLGLTSFVFKFLEALILGNGRVLGHETVDFVESFFYFRVNHG